MFDHQTNKAGLSPRHPSDGMQSGHNTRPRLYVFKRMPRSFKEGQQLLQKDTYQGDDGRFSDPSNPSSRTCTACQPDPTNAKDAVSSNHRVHFEGEYWHEIRRQHNAAVKRAFVADTAEAACVRESDIFDEAYMDDEFTVLFSVRHTAAVTSEEVEQKLDDFLYPRMWALYTNFAAFTKGLEGSGEQTPPASTPVLAAVEAESRELAGNKALHEGDIGADVPSDDTVHEREVSGDSIQEEHSLTTPLDGEEEDSGKAAKVSPPRSGQPRQCVSPSDSPSTSKEGTQPSASPGDSHVTSEPSKRGSENSCLNQSVASSGADRDELTKVTVMEADSADRLRMSVTFAGGKRWPEIMAAQKSRLHRAFTADVAEALSVTKESVLVERSLETRRGIELCFSTPRSAVLREFTDPVQLLRKASMRRTWRLYHEGVSAAAALRSNAAAKHHNDFIPEGSFGAKHRSRVPSLVTVRHSDSIDGSAVNIVCRDQIDSPQAAKVTSQYTVEFLGEGWGKVLREIDAEERSALEQKLIDDVRTALADIDGGAKLVVATPSFSLRASGEVVGGDAAAEPFVYGSEATFVVRHPRSQDREALEQAIRLYHFPEVWEEFQRLSRRVAPPPPQVHMTRHFPGIKWPDILERDAATGDAVRNALCEDASAALHRHPNRISVSCRPVSRGLVAVFSIMVDDDEDSSSVRQNVTAALATSNFPKLHSLYNGEQSEEKQQPEENQQPATEGQQQEATRPVDDPVVETEETVEQPVDESLVADTSAPGTSDEGGRVVHGAPTTDTGYTEKNVDRQSLKKSAVLSVIRLNGPRWDAISASHTKERLFRKAVESDMAAALAGLHAHDIGSEASTVHVTSTMATPSGGIAVFYVADNALPASRPLRLLPTLDSVAWSGTVEAGGGGIDNGDMRIDFRDPQADGIVWVSETVPYGTNGDQWHTVFLSGTGWCSVASTLTAQLRKCFEADATAALSIALGDDTPVAVRAAALVSVAGHGALVHFTVSPEQASSEETFPLPTRSVVDAAIRKHPFHAVWSIFDAYVLSLSPLSKHKNANYVAARRYREVITSYEGMVGTHPTATPNLCFPVPTTMRRPWGDADAYSGDWVPTAATHTHAEVLQPAEVSVLPGASHEEANGAPATQTTGTDDASLLRSPGAKEPVESSTNSPSDAVDAAANVPLRGFSHTSSGDTDATPSPMDTSTSTSSSSSGTDTRSEADGGVNSSRMPVASASHPRSKLREERIASADVPGTECSDDASPPRVKRHLSAEEVCSRRDSPGATPIGSTRQVHADRRADCVDEPTTPSQSEARRDMQPPPSSGQPSIRIIGYRSPARPSSSTESTTETSDPEEEEDPSSIDHPRTQLRGSWPCESPDPTPSNSPRSRQAAASAPSVMVGPSAAGRPPRYIPEPLPIASTNRGNYHPVSSDSDSENSFTRSRRRRVVRATAVSVPNPFSLTESLNTSRVSRPATKEAAVSPITTLETTYHPISSLRAQEVADPTKSPESVARGTQTRISNSEMMPASTSDPLPPLRDTHPKSNHHPHHHHTHHNNSSQAGKRDAGTTTDLPREHADEVEELVTPLHGSETKQSKRRQPHHGNPASPHDSLVPTRSAHEVVSPMYPVEDAVKPHHNNRIGTSPVEPADYCVVMFRPAQELQGILDRLDEAERLVRKRPGHLNRQLL